MPLNVVYRTQNNGEREVIDQKGETPEVLGKKEAFGTKGTQEG